MNAVVTQVDHVLFEVADPRSIHALLVERLGLPAAWSFTEMGPFASGGVVLGDADLEVLRWGPGSVFSGAPVTVRGISFQSTGLDAALAELRLRGIAPDRVMPFERTGPGERALLWTNVVLAGHLGHDRSSLVFLCQYAHDMDVSRRSHRAALEAAGGGPLGVRCLSEIVFGAREVADARRRWGALLAPHPEIAAGTWSIGNGPRLTLVPSDADRLHTLRVEVVERERARRALVAAGLGVRDDGGELAIDPSALGGIDLRLVPMRG